MFSKEMLKALDKLKLKFLLSKNMGFISALIATLDIGDMRDRPELKDLPQACDTACVDNSEMLINEDWFMSIDEKFQEIVLLHEAMHIARLHSIRMASMKDKQIANIAADYVVNRDIVRSGYDAEYMVRNHLCYDIHYDDMSEEEIYLKLVEKKQQNQNKNPNIPCCGGLGGEDDGQSNGNSYNMPDSNTGVGFDVLPLDPKKDAQQVSKLINKVSQTIELAKSRGWQIGNGIEETISDFLHPKLRWNQILRKYFNELVPGNIRTWARPNRRYPDMYRPSKDKERSTIKKIMVFVDTSASVRDEELQEYLSEIKFIHKQIKPRELHLIDFDMHINKTAIYKSRDKFKDFTFVGRGGTSYEEVMETIKKHNPEFAIIFTDLECSIPDKPNKKTNIFWIKTGDSKYAETPNYGVVIPYDTEA